MLPADIVPSATVDETAAAAVAMGAPRAVLLTGATGFLGGNLNCTLCFLVLNKTCLCVAHLLRSLLEHTEADIYCLVRARDSVEGAARIAETAAKYGAVVSVENNPRVIAVVGDLGTPRLGLSDQQASMLAATVDVILHSGSLVNFLQPYSALKPANVIGTIVRSCCHL